MPDIDRLSGDIDWIGLGFWSEKRPPEPAMEFGICLYLAGLSLSDTVSVLEWLGVDWHRTTVHRWVKKADIQPTSGCHPNHVSVDETLRLNDERFWLYAAVDADTTCLLCFRLYLTRNQAVTQMFLAECCEDHRFDDAVFLVDSAPWLQAIAC